MLCKEQFNKNNIQQLQVIRKFKKLISLENNLQIINFLCLIMYILIMYKIKN